MRRAISARPPMMAPTAMPAVRPVLSLEDDAVAMELPLPPPPPPADETVAPDDDDAAGALEAEGTAGAGEDAATWGEAAGEDETPGLRTAVEGLSDGDGDVLPPTIAAVDGLEVAEGDEPLLGVREGVMDLLGLLEAVIDLLAVMVLDGERLDVRVRDLVAASTCGARARRHTSSTSSSAGRGMVIRRV